jgi:hypothetical protein
MPHSASRSNFPPIPPRNSGSRHKRRGGAPLSKILPGPFQTRAYVDQIHGIPDYNPELPKHVITNARFPVSHQFEMGFIDPQVPDAPKEQIYRYALLQPSLSPASRFARCTAKVAVNPPIIGTGDASSRKAAEDVAYLAAAYQLYANGYVL